MVAETRAYSFMASRIAVKLHPPTMLVEYRPIQSVHVASAAEQQHPRVRVFQLSDSILDVHVSELTSQVMCWINTHLLHAMVPVFALNSVAAATMWCTLLLGCAHGPKCGLHCVNLLAAGVARITAWA